MEKKKYDLEDRLVDAAQLIRSCHSPTFNYGEAQGAESPKDFVHKIAIVLKELKECRTALKIIRKKAMLKSLPMMESSLKETEELVAIFAKSITTAKANHKIV